MATCNPHPNAGVAAKEVNLPTRQDVYVEKQRPLWSYRTSILQVGRAGSPAAEYRTFLDFDLTSLAASGSKIIRAALVLHPLLAASGARLTHYACLLKDSSWHADELTWQNMPDAQCVDRAAQPCCGEVLGSWEPKPSKPVEVDITYWAKAALESGASKLLSIQLFAPTAASSREHYYVQYLSLIHI